MHLRNSLPVREEREQNGRRSRAHSRSGGCWCEGKEERRIRRRTRGARGIATEFGPGNPSFRLSPASVNALEAGKVEYVSQG